MLGNTTIQGLRETFLMREGLLKKQENSYELHVEEKTFDMLIDKIPWSYGLAKLPWMETPIHVTWR